MITTYIGIDPGERWTGFAIMMCRLKGCKVDTGVIDAASFQYRAADILTHVLNEIQSQVAGEIHVICEDYHVRPVGYQQFTRANTARLIGALEYTVHSYEGVSWSMELPMDPNGQLKLLKIGRLIESWKMSWPSCTSRHWEHARSAWRVMGSHLLKNNPDLLTQSNLVRTGPISSYQKYIDPNVDYWAPTARWI